VQAARQKKRAKNKSEEVPLFVATTSAPAPPLAMIVFPAFRTDFPEKSILLFGII
jgi:hypothetical protein